MNNWYRSSFVNLLKPFLAVLICVGMTMPAYAQSLPLPPKLTVSPCSASMFCPGEDLTYEVSWFGIQLGRIRLRTYDLDRSGGVLKYRAVASIDSYDGLPFVDVHAVDNTVMDSNYQSIGFRGIEKKDDKWLVEASNYDLPHRLLVIQRYYQRDTNSPPLNSPTYDTLWLKNVPVQDGLSILSFARTNVRSGRMIQVPTVVYGKEGSTIFHFSGGIDSIEIDALKDRKIRVVTFDGKAEFEGLFGLTGDFKGWFSDDNAAVPIKAEMKVLIGSVKIELIRWRRFGWSPPW